MVWLGQFFKFIPLVMIVIVFGLWWFFFFFSSFLCFSLVNEDRINFWESRVEDLVNRTRVRGCCVEWTEMGCDLESWDWRKGYVKEKKKRTMDAQMYSRMWQTPNLYSTYKHPALMQLQANNNEFHSWFHSRKPSVDDVGNPTSVNARWVPFNHVE